jgi:uncharacterized lipoprotein YmbA
MRTMTRAQIRSGITLLGGTLLVVGCLGSPKDTATFHTLAIPPTEEPMHDGSLTGKVLGIGPVSAAGHLDQPYLVYREAPTQLVLADSARWAAPVEQMILERVTDRLQILTGALDVRVYPWPLSSPPAVQVTLWVSEFEIGESGEARIAAAWTIRDGATRESLDSDRFVTQVGGGSATAGDQVRWLTQGLDQLAAEIAMRLDQLAP